MSAPIWGQTFDPLHSFPVSGEDGIKPQTSLTLASDGNFYGVASGGGAHGVGTLFKYSITEGFSVIHDFDPATTGSLTTERASGQLVNIGDGFLYGTTFAGGTPPSGAGAVYRFDPFTREITVIFAIPSAGNTTPQDGIALTSGEPNVLQVLCYDYSGIWRVPLDGSNRTVSFFTSDGRKPTSIIRGSDGFLYGGTDAGGIGQQGTLFRTNADGTGWTVQHVCEAVTGRIPTGAMLEVDGNFYGVMGYGGRPTIPSVNGVLYRMSPSGEYTVLREFNDFDVPSGDLIRASDGMLYGVARSVGPGGNGNGGIYRIRIDGSGYKVLHVFDTSKNGIDYPTGRNPVGGLVQGPDGHLYGTTVGGPQNSGGGIFRLKLNLPPPPINLPPIAVDDVGVLDGANVTVHVLANDLNADNDPLLVAVQDLPTAGTVNIQNDRSIVYTPNAGEFTGDTFTYRVSDSRGGSSIGTVTIQTTPADPLVVAGTYNGLVALDENVDGEGTIPRGQFVITVNDEGKFTGTLFAKKKRAAFKGTFASNGTALASLKIPEQGPGFIFFAFQAGDPNTVAAVVLGTEFWSGEAGPTIPSGFEENRSFTVLISPESAPSVLPSQLPAGHGYGVVTMKPTGAVTMIGKLGDGTNLKCSTRLIRWSATQKSIPIFAEPAKNGVFSSLATADLFGAFQGDARWIRPTLIKPYPLGFDGEADLRITPFVPPTGDLPVIGLASGVVGLFDLPNDLPSTSGGFSIEGKKITSESPLRALTINPKNGLFAGTMRVGNETVGFKTLNFKGAIDQTNLIGLGQVSVKGVTGAVELFHPAD